MIWLIAEIILPIIVAGLLGLGFGYWVAARLCDRRIQDRDAQIARLKLERDNAAANRPPSSGPVILPTGRSMVSERPSEAVGGPVEPSLRRETAEPTGKKPPGLSQPRLGGADILQKINGIGPKIEQTLNDLGIYHFDQIAAWSRDEVSWIDSHLKFRGRIERERWIEQARSLSDAAAPSASTSANA